MCFADDLLLFCKGDVPSLMLLLRAFATFSSASGLQANSSKSEIYTAKVPPELIQRMFTLSKFKSGKLPFKYLGVPISSRKLSIVDCEVLVEKVVRRIRT